VGCEGRGDSLAGRSAAVPGDHREDEAFFEGVATPHPEIVAILLEAFARSWAGNQPLGGLDLGSGKPEHIFAQTGRLPAFAGGNADVDIEMLTCAMFACSSITTTLTASSPTPRPPRSPWPRPGSWAGRS
jgi:hypothetical protein